MKLATRHGLHHVQLGTLLQAPARWKTLSLFLARRTCLGHANTSAPCRGPLLRTALEQLFSWDCAVGSLLRPSRHSMLHLLQWLQLLQRRRCPAARVLWRSSSCNSLLHLDTATCLPAPSSSTHFPELSGGAPGFSFDSVCRVCAVCAGVACASHCSCMRLQLH